MNASASALGTSHIFIIAETTMMMNGIIADDAGHGGSFRIIKASQDSDFRENTSYRRFNKIAGFVLQSIMTTADFGGEYLLRQPR